MILLRRLRGNRNTTSWPESDCLPLRRYRSRDHNSTPSSAAVRCRPMTSAGTLALQSIGGDDDDFSGDHILPILKGSLDSHENTWDICSTCYGSLIYFRIPRFSCENRINVTLCQNYPSVLDDLTHVEECLIARYHPLELS
jgi:hypothetical protein